MTLIVNTSQTVSTDQTPATGTAIDYGADAVTLTIDEGTLIKSQDNIAIFSANTNALSTLINNGNILSADNTSTAAVEFRGINSTIINNAGRSIVGADIGILASGDGETITNHGTISGLTGIGVIYGNNCILTNDGDIYGNLDGILAEGSNDGGTIINLGTIRSDFFGIDTFTITGSITFIDNRGTISGTFGSITTDGSGAISLNNRGTLNGQILCDATGTDADTVRNSGTINGEVHLADGNDSFNGKGGTSGAVFGEAGNDTLTGGSHKDTLIGGLDKDTLTGGRGADKFVFNDVLESVVGINRDLIKDFSHAQHDKINLSAIDANTIAANDQAFKLIGSQHFHHRAGELRYAGHILQGDDDGDGVTDFQIHVNAAQLVKGDFIL